MLSLSNVSKRYGRADRAVDALRHVSLDVAEGEFVVVRGPSGCGKTTLLLAAGGLLAPDEGTVAVAGRDPYALDADARADLRASAIGFVFQRFHLLPYLSVIDNVLAPSLAARRGGGDDARRRALQLIERFGLAGRADHLPSELSTGEQQRAALARALLNGPSLVLADEPTGNLDDDNGREVLAALAELARDGRAVLLVTHDARAEAFAQRTVFLDDGRIADPQCPVAAADSSPSKGNRPS
jgi:ABC-type lipoprotein export system ATPase subunit